MTTSAVSSLSSTQIRAARTATFVIFALAGVTFAAWASRIVDLKRDLHLSAGVLGVTLFAMSIGSVIALPLTGRVVEWIGVLRTLQGGITIAVAGLVSTGVGLDAVQSRPVVMVGLFLLGFGMGGWDVAMNLEAADVERHLARSVMPHFHAAFSGGTVVSALVGAFLSWARVPVLAHLIGVGVVVILLGLWAVRYSLPHEETAAGAAAAARSSQSRQRSAWTEPRTLLVGVLVFVAAFTEGTANDWVAVAFHEGHALPEWAGVLAFATFLTSMTAGRIAGTGLIDRHGRVPVLRACFLLALVGSLLVVFGDVWMAFVGAAAWGIGASLGFPVGMSAAADDPTRAAGRMSVIATIGYGAFLAGPPLLGFLGDHVGVLRALLVVGTMALVALLVVPAAKEPEASPGVPA